MYTIPSRRFSKPHGQNYKASMSPMVLVQSREWVLGYLSASVGDHAEGERLNPKSVAVKRYCFSNNNNNNSIPLSY